MSGRGRATVLSSRPVGAMHRARPDRLWFRDRHHLVDQKLKRSTRMKSGRIILAAIVGSIIVFVWSAVAHMVLPIGEMGVKSLPSEEKVVPALKDAIKEPGL